MEGSMVQHGPASLVHRLYIFPSLEDGLQSTALAVSGCQVGTSVASGVNS